MRVAALAPAPQTAVDRDGFAWAIAVPRECFADGAGAVGRGSGSAHGDLVSGCGLIYSAPKKHSGPICENAQAILCAGCASALVRVVFSLRPWRGCP